MGLVSDWGGVDNNVKLIKLPFGINKFSNKNELLWLVEVSDHIGLNDSRVVIASAWVSPRTGGVVFVAPWFVEPTENDLEKTHLISAIDSALHFSGAF